LCRSFQAQQDEKLVIAQFETYHSVHPVIRYLDGAHLRSILDAQILSAAEEMYAELKPRAVL
jgi:hypothetical protein